MHGYPAIYWEQDVPLRETERHVENFSIIFAPGVLFYVWAALHTMTIPPFWLLLVCLFFGTIPGGIIVVIAIPLLRNARYAKLSPLKATPMLLQSKPHVMGLKTAASMLLVPNPLSNKFDLHFSIPATSVYAHGDYKNNLTDVNADDVVDFTVQDGQPWIEIKGVSFSVIIMRLKNGETRIAALHLGGPGKLFPLQQTLMLEFITKRPRGGWAGQKQAAAAAQRRLDNDII